MRCILIVGVLLLMFSCKTSHINNKMTFANNPVIAHRGAWKTNNHPQNSIAALQRAIELGANGSEFDVRITKDKILIVTHDADYHEMIVEDHIYEDLAKIFLSNGEKLPTLRDFIVAGMKNNNTTGLVIEIKPSKTKGNNDLMAQKAVALVKELNAEAYVHSYISFSYKVLKKIRELDTQVNLQYLDGSKSPAQLAQDSINMMDYYMSVYKYKPQWVEDSRSRNMKLNVWTVNKSEDLDYFLNADFDYISTDEPEMLFSKLEDRKNK